MAWGAWLLCSACERSSPSSTSTICEAYADISLPSPLIALPLSLGDGRDYPHFYQQLYALLTVSMFYVKHRTTFFPLLDQFLSST